MSVLPKNSSRTNASEQPAGTLVTYDHDGAHLVAAVIGGKSGKINILNQRGREVEVTPNRLHVLPGSLPAELSSTAKRAEYLASIAESAAAQKLPLEEIWQLVQGDHAEIETGELAKIYFGNNTLHNHLALHLALVGDRIYFKRDKDVFYPRPPEVTDELKKAQAAQEARQKLFEEVSRFCKERLKNPGLPIPADLRWCIELLEDVAAEAPHLDPGRHKEASNLINICGEALAIDWRGTARENHAYQILASIKHFSPSTNLALFRHRPLLSFSAESAALASSLRSMPESIENELREGLRRDLRHLHLITIDDASTEDMDDAVSLEKTENGYLLGIHISDVASILPCPSKLDEEAGARATSVYLPERTIHMLPDFLAKKTCSLLVGEPRPALSFLFDLSSKGDIRSSEITSSTVMVRERKTYEEVDDILDTGAPGTLLELNHLTAANEARRLADGAQPIPKKEILFTVAPDNTIQMRIIDEASASRMMVAELMVMANALAASWAAEHRLPLIFRSQEPSVGDADPALLEIPEGPARDYAIKSTLKRSINGVELKPHYSLGLKAYCQITSPIRRYIDLLNHRQIIHFLRHGHPRFSADELAAFSEALEQPLHRANALTRESRRFWMLRYFETKLPRDTIVRGTVVRIDPKFQLVELEDYYTTVFAKLKKQTRIGAQVSLKITGINPKDNFLRLEQVG